MCGIVGVVGRGPSRELLLEGLERLEHRGYDSAGVSLADATGSLERVRTVGRIEALRAAADTAGDGAVAGIAHTRWATHGGVCERNAHPLTDTSERVHIVLNGIVENHAELRAEIVADGGRLSSETDAEVVAHLIARRYRGRLAEAADAAAALCEGRFAFLAMCADEPGVLVAVRRGCPLVLGVGGDRQFAASAIAAFVHRTRDVIHLRDGDTAELRAAGVSLLREPCDGRGVERVEWADDSADRGRFETFMLKEIHEQPRALAETLDAARDQVRAVAREVGAPGLRRIRIVACGTSYHAGLLARWALERWAAVPTEVEIASEYRYREPLPEPGELVIGISQSGETADTLAALREARRRGARVLALTNVMGSQITREADAVLFTKAGAEVGVAATKTFVAQAAALERLALELAHVRSAMPRRRIRALLGELEALPAAVGDGIGAAAEWAEAVRARFDDAGFFLYLGRGPALPIALEGALKLREVAYVPTDAYAAGEMKHGPIALLAEGTPVICVATASPTLSKMLANISEVRARGAAVLAVAGAGYTQVAEHAEEVVYVPEADPLVQPLAAVVPLQLLAHEVALSRGLDVDRPRNLAKTVTVE